LSKPSRKSNGRVNGDNRNLAEGIAADYDAEGRLSGIEILDALKRFGDPQTLRQIILEDVGLVRT
jgi:uncharacterized protein YuzE